MSVCGELAGAASLGAAPALRAVDCLANETAASAFARLFGGGGQGGGALLPALTILLTLYIALFAFALITGRSRLGVAALTPRMMTLGLVLTFATSWLTWQQVVWNLAIGAPDQLASILIASTGSATRIFADRLDVIAAAIAAAAEAVGSGSGGARVAVVATAPGTFSPEGLMWLGTTLLLLGTVAVLATARIALAVLLAVGPVFVVLGLFRGTRGLTAGWLRAVVMTALAPLFTVLAGSITFELVVPVVASLPGTGGIDARAAMSLFLIAAVHCALIGLVLKVTATVVAAWNVFGLGSSDREVAAAAAPAVAAPSAPAAAVAPPAAAIQGVARTVRAAVAGSSAAGAHAGVPRPADAPSARSRISPAAVSLASLSDHPPPPPHLRAQGVGSRFAARPPLSRIVMR